MLTKERIAQHVWVIYGENETDVSKAFVRFQEYYENKDLKGNKNITTFNIETWWDGYKQSLETEDSYYEYWQGFNLPGKVILDLMRYVNFRGDVMRYNRQETELLVLFEDLSIEEISDGYFIGLWKDAEQVLDHEIAHALFSTDQAYMLEQTINIAKLPNNIYTMIRNHLTELGYGANVVHDEIQAYFSTYNDTLGDTFETTAYDTYTTPFVDTFNKFHT